MRRQNRPMGPYHQQNGLNHESDSNHETDSNRLVGWIRDVDPNSVVEPNREVGPNRQVGVNRQVLLNREAGLSRQVGWIRRRRQTGGWSIALLIVLSFLSLTLALAYAGVVLTRKQLFLHRERRLKARALAHSGLADAVGSFRADRQFGKGGEKLEESWPYPEDPKAGYRLQFGLRESINNWGSDVPVYFDTAKTQVACPAGGLFLTAVGTYQGHSERVSALLAAPPFDSAIASRGSLTASDGFILGSVAADFDASKPFDVADLKASQMQVDGELTIRRGAVRSTIVGSAKSSREAHYDKDAVEIREGAIEPFAKVDQIPDIDVAALNFPSDGVQKLSESRFPEKEKLGGLVEWTGSQLVFEQGLHLNGATLRVHGNLEIRGGVVGSGAIICDGNVTVTGASSLATDNQVAVVSGGGISVVGTGRDNSYFRGLLYAKGANGISIANSTVLGTVISTAPQAPMEVERSTIAFSKAATKFDVDLGWSGYDPEKGIDVPATGLGAVPGVLKLAPLPGMAAGTTPKPADFIKAGITKLGPEHFLLIEGGKTYFTPGANMAWNQAMEKAGLIADTRSKISDSYRDSKAANGISESLRSNNDNPKNLAFKLDINQFLKTSDRLRIVWKR